MTPHTVQRFLFCFGYEDPGEREVNARYGTDHESSTGVFILASSEQEAMSWGCEIAECFLRFVVGDDAYSWRAAGFAHWIEPDPETSDWAHCLSFFPVVTVGRLPDLPSMTAEAYTQWQKERGIAR